DPAACKHPQAKPSDVCDILCFKPPQTTMPLKRPRVLLERFLPDALVQYVAGFLSVRAALDFFTQVLGRSDLRIPWPRIDGASTAQLLFSQLPSLYRAVQRLALLPR